MKTTVDKINSRLDISEEKIRKHEDGNESYPNETQKEWEKRAENL